MYHSNLASNYKCFIYIFILVESSTGMVMELIYLNKVIKSQWVVSTSQTGNVSPSHLIWNYLIINACVCVHPSFTFLDTKSNENGLRLLYCLNGWGFTYTSSLGGMQNGSTIGRDNNGFNIFKFDWLITIQISNL